MAEAVQRELRLSHWGASLPDPGQIKSISIRGEAGSLAGVECLPGLRSLTLKAVAHTDLTPISHLAELETLFLSFSGELDLAALSGVPHLRELFLERCGIDDLSSFPPLSRLRILILSNNQISDPGKAGTSVVVTAP